MKYLSLLLLPLILVACGQKNSAQKSSKSTRDSVKQSYAAHSDSITIPDSLHITKKFVTGQFNFRKRNNFVKVAPKYAAKRIYLQKATYRAFKKMARSAKKDGIRLIIVSGTRNFTYQKRIWDRKWRTFKAPSAYKKALKILKFSSMPMTSRHHWGTDMDLNNLNNSYFAHGKGKREYQWLKAHANHFGFYQPYTKKSLHGRTGYEEEKWHWSYMPLAVYYLKYYNEHVTNADITGFKGSRFATKINMVKNYVDGVSRKIKQYTPGNKKNK